MQTKEIKESKESKNPDVHVQRHSIGVFSVRINLSNPRIRLPDLSALAITNLLISIGCPDLIETYEVSPMDNKSMEFTVAMKFQHFFKDIGLSKKHIKVHAHMEHLETDNVISAIKCVGVSMPVVATDCSWLNQKSPRNPNSKKKEKEDDASEAIHLSSFTVVCTYPTPHECQVEAVIALDIAAMKLPTTVETFVIAIVKKIMKRAKEFIEKM